MSDPPLLNPNWLTHPTNVELAIAAFKRQRQVWDQTGDLTIGQEQIPGPFFQNDADILHFIRGNLAPVWHAAATCRMGNALDAMAVVDTNMRVYGVERATRCRCQQLSLSSTRISSGDYIRIGRESCTCNITSASSSHCDGGIMKQTILARCFLAYMYHGVSQPSVTVTRTLHSAIDAPKKGTRRSWNSALPLALFHWPRKLLLCTSGPNPLIY